jgi:hypothetical protein
VFSSYVAASMALVVYRVDVHRRRIPCVVVWPEIRVINELNTCHIVQ